MSTSNSSYGSSASGGEGDERSAPNSWRSNTSGGRGSSIASSARSGGGGSRPGLRGGSGVDATQARGRGHGQRARGSVHVGGRDREGSEEESTTYSSDFGGAEASASDHNTHSDSAESEMRRGDHRG